jgi:[ribosomal protein S18]-alanine N-acetyltransferase
MTNMTNTTNTTNTTDTTLNIKQINTENEFTGDLNRENFIEFLYTHLDRFGDSREAIGKSIDYAFSKAEGKGGFLLAAYDNNDMIGALVMIHTAMAGYIPEHFLVYVAVTADCRGKGYGRQIIDHAINLCDGDVALHVEYDNPAKRLYERIGFKNKYAEMRFKKD